MIYKTSVCVMCTIFGSLSLLFGSVISISYSSWVWWASVMSLASVEQSLTERELFSRYVQ